MLGASFLAAGGIVNNLDIKRKLGVGMATWSDHLREYKDPFEPSDVSQEESVPDLEFELFVLCKTAGDAKSKPLSQESERLPDL